MTAVLFDVDGTLVNSNYLHAVTWWQAFGQAGHQVPMADIHRAIGMGSDKLLGRLLPADRDRSQDAEIQSAHSALYATYWSRLQPLPGAVALLRLCKQRGLRVVLASSADEREFRALRAALDADDAIDAATYAGENRPQQAGPGPGPDRAGQGGRAGRPGGLRRGFGLGHARLPAGGRAGHRLLVRRHRPRRAQERGRVGDLRRSR